MTVAGRFDGSFVTIALSWRCHQGGYNSGSTTSGLLQWCANPNDRQGCDSDRAIE